jgi:hypothetical protein
LQAETTIFLTAKFNKTPALFVENQENKRIQRFFNSSIYYEKCIKNENHYCGNVLRGVSVVFLLPGGNAV